MSTATPLQPDYTTQSGSQYKANIDAMTRAVSELAAAFSVHESATPDMNVVVDSGAQFTGATIIEQAAQTLGPLTAPGVNPRIDLVELDPLTGTAYVITGTENASPSIPSVTSGRVPLAYFQLETSTVVIDNTIIVPVRFSPWGAVLRDGSQTITGAKTFTNTVTVEGTNPGIKLSDTTAGADDFWLYADTDTFSVLTDRDDSGAWDGANPLELNNTTSVGSLYGSEIITNSNLVGRVGQNELKTSVGEVSVTTPYSQIMVLPGGAHGFYPRLRSNLPIATAYWGSSDPNQNYVASTYGDSYSASINIYANNNAIASAQQRYVTASPPYDLGDGEVPFFIFANVDSQGNIVSVYSADTPPWIYNGPTKVTADRHTNDGKQYIKHNNFSMPAPIKSNSSMAQKVAYKKAVLEAKRSAVEDEIELTPLMKNADMDLIPHPFEASPDFTPILLDPMSQTTIDLMELCDNGNGESVNEIIHDNYINVGNTPLARSGPAGLMIVDARWK